VACVICALDHIFAPWLQELALSAVLFSFYVEHRNKHMAGQSRSWPASWLAQTTSTWLQYVTQPLHSQEADDDHDLAYRLKLPPAD